MFIATWWYCIVIWQLVMWPIIVLKFSYGHHQFFQTPFTVIRICCFFHDSRPPYAKSVAFKIHSIEIEDQSHHWRPVVYLHEDTKGHLLSRWIAEKNWLFNFLIIILILMTSIPFLFSCFIIIFSMLMIIHFSTIKKITVVLVVTQSRRGFLIVS